MVKNKAISASLTIWVIFSLLLSNVGPVFALDDRTDLGSNSSLQTVTTWYVSTGGADTNTCLGPEHACETIVAVLGKANDGDIIKVTSSLTESNTTALLTLDKDLTLVGGWDESFSQQRGMTILDGGDMAIGLTVASSADVTLERFLIEHAITGIMIQPGAALSLNQSAVHANQNGGIVNYGTLYLSNTTLSENSSTTGGGLLLESNSTAFVNNSTIVYNQSVDGGGVYLNPGSKLEIQNSILARNTSLNGIDCYTAESSSLTSLGFNIIGESGQCDFTSASGDLVSIDPLITSWLAAGYHALVAGSPAVSAGNPATCQAMDVRAVERGESCDIGAYEYQEVGNPASITVQGGSGQETLVGERSDLPLHVLVTDEFGSPVSGVLVKVSAPDAGASATFESLQISTDEAGIASFPFTANDRAGSYDVTVTVDSLNESVAFSLTNIDTGLISALSIPVAPTLGSPPNGFITNDNTPDFAWNSVTDGDIYEIQIDDSSTFTAPIVQKPALNPGELTYTATTLPNKIYYWRVRARNADNQPGPWSAKRSFTIDTKASAAPVLKAPAAAAKVRATPSFSWNASTGANKYQFEYDNDSDFSSPIYTSAGLSTLTHKPPAMELGTYYWHVRAGDAAGNWSVWSTARTLTLTLPLPAAPTLVSPATGFATNDNTPDFAWNSAANGNTYQIQIDDSSTFTAPILQSFTGAPDELTYTATTLLSKTYYWRVRAYNINGEAGAWSAKRSFKVDTVAPPIPVLQAPAKNASVRGTPTFSWTASNGASRYQFEYDNNADFSSPIYTSIELSTLTHTPPTMEFGVYSWHVRARDAVGNWSNWSAVRTINVLQLIPNAPTLASPATGYATNDTTPTFSWNAVTAGNTYEIQIDDSSTFAAPILQTSVGAVGELSYTATTLLSKTYYWRVRAYNINNEFGAWSASRSFIIDTVAPPIPVLAAPASAAVLRATPAFSWNASTAASRYQFEYDNDSDFSSPTYTSIELSTLTHTPPAMELGTYSWHVRARDAAGNWSNWSTARTLTLIPPIPVAPSLVSPANDVTVTTPRPTFTWNTVYAGDTYQIQIDDVNTFASPEFTYKGLETSIDSTYLLNGTYYWRVRAYNINSESGPWSTARSVKIDAVPDTTPPTNPSGLQSSDHTVSQFSLDNIVDVTWTDDADDGTGSGLKGFSVLWDQDPTGSPDTVIDHLPTILFQSSPVLADGTWYFHLRTCDRANNCSTSIHLGPFSVDTTIPVNPTSLTSSSHTVSQASNINQVVVNWSADATDGAGSGVAGFSSIWDQTANTIPDTTADHISTVVTTTSVALADGSWYFHLRTCDTLELCSVTKHIGPFIIDTTMPGQITTLSAASDAVSGQVNLSWTAVGDDGSTGIAKTYLVRYNTTGVIDSQAMWDSATPITNGVPTPKIAGQAESMTVNGLTIGTTYYFAVRVQDEVPNIGALSNSPSVLIKGLPASITTLTATTGPTIGTVNLGWTSVGSDGNIGTASSYLVRYSIT